MTANKLTEIKDAVADYEAAMEFLKDPFNGGVEIRGRNQAIVNIFPSAARVAIQTLLPIAEAAMAFNDESFFDNDYGQCACCGGAYVAKKSFNDTFTLLHKDDCPVKVLYTALAALTDT